MKTIFPFYVFIVGMVVFCGCNSEIKSFFDVPDIDSTCIFTIEQQKFTNPGLFPSVFHMWGRTIFPYNPDRCSMFLLSMYKKQKYQIYVGFFSDSLLILDADTIPSDSLLTMDPDPVPSESLSTDDLYPRGSHFIISTSNKHAIEFLNTIYEIEKDTTKPKYTNSPLSLPYYVEKGKQKRISLIQVSDSCTQLTLKPHTRVVDAFFKLALNVELDSLNKKWAIEGPVKVTERWRWHVASELSEERKFFE